MVIDSQWQRSSLEAFPQLEILITIAPHFCRSGTPGLVLFFITSALDRQCQSSTQTSIPPIPPLTLPLPGLKIWETPQTIDSTKENQWIAIKCLMYTQTASLPTQTPLLPILHQLILSMTIYPPWILLCALTNTTAGSLCTLDFTCLVRRSRRYRSRLFDLLPIVHVIDGRRCSVVLCFSRWI